MDITAATSPAMPMQPMPVGRSAHAGRTTIVPDRATTAHHAQPAMIMPAREHPAAASHTPDPLPADAFLCDLVSQRPVGQDTLVLELKPRDPHIACDYPAGAHLELQLAAGPRQYSLCHHQGGAFRLAVQREWLGRGGSREVFERAGRHDAFWVRGPFNLFDTDALHQASQVKLIAGGIGITPILAMAYARYQRGQPFEMHYSARHASGMPFVDELRAMAAVHPDTVALHLYASQDANGRRPDLAEALGEWAPGMHAYVCGPTGMIEAVQDAAFALGWPDAQVHIERFGAEAPKPQAGDGAFEIEIASSGTRIRVERDETVAEALAKAGIVIPISCAAGVCGSCRTRIVAGEADHRDLFYSPEEQASQTEFTPCCSRAHSPVLVLDL